MREKPTQITAADRRDLATEAECEIRQKLAWSVGTIEFDPQRHSGVESLLAEADATMYDNKARHRIANG